MQFVISPARNASEVLSLIAVPVIVLYFVHLTLHHHIHLAVYAPMAITRIPQTYARSATTPAASASEVLQVPALLAQRIDYLIHLPSNVLA